SVRAFVRGKLGTIAILKCLGASSRQVLAVYLLQTLLLGLGGSALGAGVGSAVPPLLAPFLGRLLPIPLDGGVSPVAILRGLAMGVGVTLLFSLWPLLEIRRVPPALILRSEVEATLTGHRPWPAALVIVGGLAALCLWQAGSWKVGGLFVGGLAGPLSVPALSARSLIAASRFGRRGQLVWRQAVANIVRPGSQAGAVLISLGLAVMLIVAIALLDGSLRRELTHRSAGGAPAFFFVDVQPDQ